MGILLWIIFGLIVGVIARLIMPEADGLGIIATVILGVIGAVVGGWLSSVFGGVPVTGFNLYSFIVAVIGAIVVIGIVRLVKRL